MFEIAQKYLECEKHTKIERFFQIFRHLKSIAIFLWIFGIFCDMYLYCQESQQPGGHGIEWDINLSVSAATLYRIGKKVPLSVSDFQSFVVHRVVNVAEAAEILNCSRQNIDYLTRTGKLHPIKSSGKNTLYLKSEILKRNWQ